MAGEKNVPPVAPGGEAEFSGGGGKRPFVDYHLKFADSTVERGRDDVNKGTMQVRITAPLSKLKVRIEDGVTTVDLPPNSKVTLHYE